MISFTRNDTYFTFFTKADSFQSDIYPPVPSTEPSVTAAEFFNGKTPTLNFVSLADGSAVAPSSSPSASFSAAPPAPAPASIYTQPSRSYSASAPTPGQVPVAPSPNTYSTFESTATPISSDSRESRRSHTLDSKVRCCFSFVMI